LQDARASHEQRIFLTLCPTVATIYATAQVEPGFIVEKKNTTENESSITTNTVAQTVIMQPYFLNP
jgi:hypothetical protein